MIVTIVCSGDYTQSTTVCPGPPDPVDLETRSAIWLSQADHIVGGTVATIMANGSWGTIQIDHEI